MKISKKFLDNPVFVENSIINKEFFAIGIYLDEEQFEEFFLELIPLYPETYEKLLFTLVKIIREIKKGRYKEAREFLGMKDHFNTYSEEILGLRNWIKSWLYGLIATSRGSWGEIQRLQVRIIHELDKPIDPLYERLAKNIPYRKVLEAFSKVKTNADLQYFNHIFEGYILDLIFHMSDIIISRVQVCMELLSTEIRFEEVCKKIDIHLKHFRRELDELRR